MNLDEPFDEAMQMETVPSRYGYMDVDRWHREGFFAQKARVLINGVDITDRCTWFNDVTGEAECLVYDDGKPAVIKGYLRHELLKGNIDVKVQL